MPAPPEWTTDAMFDPLTTPARMDGSAGKCVSGCTGCRVLMNELEGAKRKIERLQAILSNRVATQVAAASRVSPTARMAAIWAQQNEEKPCAS